MIIEQLSLIHLELAEQGARYWVYLRITRTAQVQY